MFAEEQEGRDSDLLSPKEAKKKKLKTKSQTEQVEKPTINDP